jgi:F420-dependent oxidoreductase-like protein
MLRALAREEGRVSEVRFGLFYPQVGQSFGDYRDRAQLAERLGYDSVFCVDHMWQRGMPEVDHLEAWTLLSALAASTSKIRLGALVLCNSYRNPALLAKMVSSLDQVSAGRVVLGLGAGWMEEEYDGYGYSFPPTLQRIEQLDEALDVIKRLFTEKCADFQGKYYTLQQAYNRPAAVQKPHPPILIGGGGEKHMLRVVARHADIWNCPNNHSLQLEKRLAALKRHCDERGRDFSEIEVSEQSFIVVGTDEADFKKKWEMANMFLGSAFDLENTAFRGTPDQVVEQLQKRVAQGVTFFTFLSGDFHAPDTLQLIAEQVVPAFR